MKKTLLILILGIATIAYAKQVSVDVKTPQDQKTLKAEVVNITPDTIIDITQAFSASDKDIVASGLNLTQGESLALNAVLSGQTLQYNQVADYVSALNKQVHEKALSSDEIKMISGLDGKKKEAGEISKFLARKKIKDI